CFRDHILRGVRLLAVIGVLLAATTLSAADEKNLFAERDALWKAYAGQLETLAAWCDEQQLPAEAKRLRTWRPQPQPLTFYLFLPPGGTDTPLADAAPPAARDAHARFQVLRTAQATAAFALSRQAVEAEQFALALQLGYETLREDPEHVEARRILGYQKTDD